MSLVFSRATFREADGAAARGSSSGARRYAPRASPPASEPGTAGNRSVSLPQLQSKGA